MSVKRESRNLIIDMNSPLISGVHAFMLGVNEFEPLQRVFVDAMGWDVIGQWTLPKPLCAHLWDADSAAQVMVLASRGVNHGRIHLYRFEDLDATEPEALGPRAYGFRAMNTYVRDMQVARRRVEAAGATWGAETRFDITSVDGTTQSVHQGRVLLPDAAGLVFVKPTIPRWTAAWSKDDSVFCPEATSVVVSSHDADASKRFWGPEGLGLEIRYDVEQRNPDTNKMIGLEPDAAVRVVFCWAEKTSRVEILGRAEDPYAHIECPDATRQQRPGLAKGAIGWVIQVRDLDGALTQMVQAGGRIIAEPVEGSAGFHPGQVATVQTPENTWISVWGS